MEKELFIKNDKFSDIFSQIEVGDYVCTIALFKGQVLGNYVKC